MCGILCVDVKRGTSAVKPLLKRYRKQDHRGHNGYGYVTINEDGYVSEVVRDTTEEGIIAALQNENASKIMFHHRAPTSLPNYLGATHPFFISDDRFKFDYYVIHNGVINNHTTIWEGYKKEGIKFLSEMVEGKFHEFVNTGEYYDKTETTTKVNDSEVFAVDIVHYIEGLQNWVKSSGTIAFIALQVDKSEQNKGKVISLIYGHNDGNPIELEEDKTLFVLSSEAGGKDVDSDKIYFKDWETGAVSCEEVRSLAYHGYSKNVRGKHNKTTTKAERREQRREAATSGVSRQIPFDCNPNEEEWSEADGIDQIDDAIVKMTGGIDPRNIVRRDGIHLLTEGRANADWAKELAASEGGEEKSFGFSSVINFLSPRQKEVMSSEDFTDLDLTLHDIGVDSSAIESEIIAAEVGRSDADAGVLRQLSDDIEQFLGEENDALRELRAAEEFLKEVANLKPYNSEMADEAKAMVDAQSTKYSECHNLRTATQAELESHLNLYGGIN